MNRNQLDGLLALKLIATKRNFTAAAQDLGVSPPAISKMIKQLEKRLGVTLLSRTTRSTSLTEAGERFLAEAGPALDHILSAMESVGTFAEKPSGLLRLNLPRAIYPVYFAPLIASFKKKYPDVAVELFFEDQTSDVVESGFDAGIRLSDILMKDMTVIKLFGPVQFVVAGAPKYFAKKGRPKHPKDLLAHDCILSRFGLSGLYDRWEFEHKNSEFEVQVTPSMIINDPLIMKEVASDGCGLIYTAEDCISEKIKFGRLEVVLDQFTPKSDGYYLYYPKRSQVLPKLRAFIEHVREQNKRN